MAASSHSERLRLDALVRLSGVAEVISSLVAPGNWTSLVRERGPDVIVTDSPRASPPEVPALVLSVEPAALDGAVRGSLPHDASPEELAAALQAIDSGLAVFHPAQRHRVSHDHAASPLTPRESEVLAMLAEGIGNKIIAGRLRISENTVKFHVSSIMEKLAAGSRTDAVARGLRQGLVVI